jgi:hypothetical protein
MKNHLRKLENFFQSERLRLLGASLLAATLQVVFIQPLSAATLCVNQDGSKGCHAYIQSALDMAVSGDTVQIGPGTYYEVITIPTSKALTIRGAGRGKTILDGTSRAPAAVINFPLNQPDTPPNQTAEEPFFVITIANMTIQRGYRGINAGRFSDVRLEGLEVRENGPSSGAGVFSDSSFVTLRDSLVTHNYANDAYFGCDGSGGTGGGVAAMCGSGRFTIERTAIVNNTAREGCAGAIFTGYNVQTVVNSTFSRNTVQNPAGAGSAFCNYTEQGFNLSFSTVALNTGGVSAFFVERVAAAAKFKANIIDGNSAGCASTEARPISEGFNVVSDASCKYGNVATDVLTTAARLGPQASYGLSRDGSSKTRAHELLKDSPAINRVPAADCTPIGAGATALSTDQGGISRPAGSACDSGSVVSRK